MRKNSNGKKEIPPDRYKKENRFTRAGAAEYIGISVRTLDKIPKKELPRVPNGRGMSNSPVFYIKEDLDEFLENRRMNVAKSADDDIRLPGDNIMSHDKEK